MATATRAKSKNTNGHTRSPVTLLASRPARQRPVHWTHEQYHRMAAMGWFEGRRVELVGGEIIEMTAMHSPHWTASLLAEEALRSIFGVGYVVAIQKPLVLPGFSEPEPDVAVIIGGPRDFINGLPTTAVLVVEVSHSTLHFDRITKASLYAAAGIAEYWIINLKARQLEVHRTPVKKAHTKFGWAYEDKTEFVATDTVSPLAAPDHKIKVADLLP